MYSRDQFYFQLSTIEYSNFFFVLAKQINSWIQVINATFRSEKVRYENRLVMVYDS